MKRVLLPIILAAVAFLAGFVPQFLAKRDVDTKLAQVSALSDQRLLRLQLATLIVEVEQGRSAQARDLSTQFFDHLHQVTETARPEVVPTLKALLDHRDDITSGLTAGNPGMADQLRSMFVDLTQALPEGPATLAVQP
ncbi:MAG: hypothetical protein R2762_12275 [Bryobacteraceae bacterium]